MKRSKEQKVWKPQKQPKKGWPWLMSIVGVVLVFLASGLIFALHVEQKREQDKAEISKLLESLNLWFQDKSSLRQIEIVKNAPEKLVNPDYTPVHILARESEEYRWIVLGTGALVNKHQGCLITAAHVFEGRKLQFGYRVICKNALMGNEPILPIISCDLNRFQGDIAICVVGENSTYPLLSIPYKENKVDNGKGQLKEGSEISFRKDSGNVISLTNGREYPCSLAGRTNTGEDLLFWYDNVMPKQSGSPANYVNNGKKDFVIVLGVLDVIDELARVLKPYDIKEHTRLAFGLHVKIL